jgi:hypothetical protein
MALAAKTKIAKFEKRSRGGSMLKRRKAISENQLAARLAAALAAKKTSAAAAKMPLAKTEKRRKWLAA